MDAGTAAADATVASGDGGAAEAGAVRPGVNAVVAALDAGTAAGDCNIAWVGAGSGWASAITTPENRVREPL